MRIPTTAIAFLFPLMVVCTRDAIGDSVQIHTEGNCSPAFVDIHGSVSVVCGTTAESAYWDAISGSDRISDFENYLIKYPNGTLQDAAEKKLSDLRDRYSAAINHLRDGHSHAHSYGIGGSAEWVHEQNRRALQDFDLALAAYPAFAEAHFARGEVLYFEVDDANPNYDAAMTEFKRALDLNPNYSEAYLYQGWAYDGQHEAKLACDSYINFQKTNAYLSEGAFAHYNDLHLFNRGFLDYHGCIVPDDFNLGREPPPKGPVDCDTTMYLNEIEACAEQGNARAMDHVARSIWIDAWNKQNVALEEKARALWQKVADMGDPRGELGIGEIYLSGLGVPKDCERAMSNLSQSAAANNAEALFSLGHVYLNNECVPRNIAHARELFAKSAVLGNIHAESMVQNIDSCPSNPKHWLQPCHD